MSKRRLAIVATLVVGTMVGAVYRAWQSHAPAVQQFDWGANVSGAGVLNAVRRVEDFDPDREAAADLYAACGQLLANAVLPHPALSKARVTIVDPVLGDRVYEETLGEEELGAALSLMRTGANGAGFIGFGPLFAATVFERFFGGAAAITADSPQGTQLLALCKEAAADPFALEEWLSTIDAASGTSPSQERAD